MGAYLMVFFLLISLLSQIVLALLGVFIGFDPAWFKTKKHKKYLMCGALVAAILGFIANWVTICEADKESRFIMDNITGGDGFAYVVPQIYDGLPFPLTIHNYGKTILSDVSVTVTDLITDKPL